MMRSVAIGLVVLVLQLATGAPARADENTDAARKLYESATRHFDFTEYDAALVDFKEGYRRKDDPVFLYNIAAVLPPPQQERRGAQVLSQLLAARAERAQPRRGRTPHLDAAGVDRRRRPRAHDAAADDAAADGHAAGRSVRADAGCRRTADAAASTSDDRTARGDAG